VDHVRQDDVGVQLRIIRATGAVAKRRTNDAVRVDASLPMSVASVTAAAVACDSLEVVESCLDSSVVRASRRRWSGRPTWSTCGAPAAPTGDTLVELTSGLYRALHPTPPHIPPSFD